MNERALESFIDLCDDMMVPVQEGVGSFALGVIYAPAILAGLITLSYGISSSIKKARHKKELKKTGAKKFVLELETNLKKFEALNQKAIDDIKKYKCVMVPKGYFAKLVERKNIVDTKGDKIISSALAIARELETSFDVTLFNKCNTQDEAIDLVHATNKKLIPIREKIQILENQVIDLNNERVTLPTEKSEMEEISIDSLVEYFTVNMKKIKNLSFAYDSERNHIYSSTLYYDDIWEFVDESIIKLKWIKSSNYATWSNELKNTGIAGSISNISKCVESVNYILTDLEKAYVEPINYASKLKYVKK